MASECDEAYMVVHYDLAIAKPALQIQATEAPHFDNLFIAFGPFHICLAYFGAIGHFIENSGGPEMLTESDDLGHGSLNGRMEPMLALASPHLSGSLLQATAPKYPAGLL